MQQFGGKDSKRHFTVVMEGKEHGLYISSTPSSAAKKAVTKLCAANKSKKVEFSIREITQGSKKKTYGPYKGYIEKLKEPIELKGRVIKYKPVAKLSGKTSSKKGGQRGGAGEIIVVKCNTLGSGNTLVTAEKHCENAKIILTSNSNIQKHIESITDLDGGKALKIKIKQGSEDSTNYIITVANGIYGCRARVIEKKWDGTKYITPNNSQLLALAQLS
jgi:hypothetical protein